VPNDRHGVCDVRCRVEDQQHGEAGFDKRIYELGVIDSWVLDEVGWNDVKAEMSCQGLYLFAV
jgi:hypothetical protein